MPILIPVEVRSYPHGGVDYAAAVDLRSEILRRPLGLAYSAEALAAEANETHLGAFDPASGDILGTLILNSVAGQRWKMRQVAVQTSLQGQGIGRSLVAAAETWVKAAGGLSIELHARLAVVPFYEKVGYLASGPVFEEVTLPHRFMEKLLRVTVQ